MDEEENNTEGQMPVELETKAVEQKPPGYQRPGDSSLPRDENATSTKAISSGGAEGQKASGAVRTLDGEMAGDEFAGDAVNYQVLLNKIDGLLDRLKLDA